MIIAVMSDTHDNIWNLRKALEIIKQENAGMIIHCGDFVAPFMLVELERGGVPVHGVFGNNDGDQYQLTKASLTALKRITLYGMIGEIETEGVKIGFTHYQDVAEGLAAGDKYQMVCFGHSHKYLQKQIGQTLLLNPGEIMGKDGFPGFCFFDTHTSEIKRMELK